MQHRTFGRLGWRVSAIGFGGWAIGGGMWGEQDDDESVRALHTALDRGVNFVDTAQVYGEGHSEEVIGKVLAERTEEVYVATKVPQREGFEWPPRADADARDLFPADHLISACEESLRRLGRETIDVYQFHAWAPAFNVQDEWKEAMATLKRDGKIRAVGVSVPDHAPGVVVGSLLDGTVDAVQTVYNVFDRSAEWNLFPVCQRTETAVIVRVPFDEGALTGKFDADTTFPEGDHRRDYFADGALEETVRRVEALREFKDERHPDLDLAEYALRFARSHPAVSVVIPGMRTPEQAEMNTAAGVGDPLGADERADLAAHAWQRHLWLERQDD
ncbi:aldo/keto reductase [Rubrivirga sp.]|uniref:aldo/keto reductase n=1 Tax=Rubrivirga sp. TaxID=1885344 RepID=UPI003B52EACD